MSPRRTRAVLLLSALPMLASAIAIGCGGSSEHHGGTASKSSIVLDPPDGSTLPSGTVATIYTQTFTVLSGGVPPFTFSAPTLPAGLALTPIDASATAIAGTPKQSGTTTITLQVVDSTNANVEDASYNLTIK